MYKHQEDYPRKAEAVLAAGWPHREHSGRNTPKASFSEGLTVLTRWESA